MMRFQDTIRPLLLAPFGSIASLAVFTVVFGRAEMLLQGLPVMLLLVYTYSLAAGVLFVAPVMACVPSLRRPSLWVALPWGVIAAWAAVWLTGPTNSGLRELLRWQVLIPYGAAGAVSGLIYVMTARPADLPSQANGL